MSEQPPASDVPGAASEPDMGFVALLDVLGFKTMDEARQIQVSDLLEQAVDEHLPRLWSVQSDRYGRWVQSPIVRMFSDTIVIAFPRAKGGPVAQDLMYFVNDYLGMLFCLLLEDGVKLRGAVGYGSVIERTYAVLGSALLDAEREYEATSWAGIHYTFKAMSFIMRWHQWAQEQNITDNRLLPGTEHRLMLTQFYGVRVPFKSDHTFLVDLDPDMVRHRFVVPWPKEVQSCFHVSQILSGSYDTTYTRIHRVMDEEFNQCACERVRTILAHTIEFADGYLQKFPDVNTPIEFTGPLPQME
jgi:hypothetical protein